MVTALADGARAVVLTGAEGHFCAGADLTELEDVSFTSRLAEVLEHLAAAPVTTIAAIEGSCMGLGMQLAIACDVRVVGPTAKFAVPVAKLGLMVDHWTLDRVARTWGRAPPGCMVLTGAVLDADDAWRLGFAQQRGGLRRGAGPGRPGRGARPAQPGRLEDRLRRPPRQPRRGRPLRGRLRAAPGPATTSPRAVAPSPSAATPAFRGH